MKMRVLKKGGPHLALDLMVCLAGVKLGVG